MTKFDIRLRRKQFTHSRIERYKNYQSLMERHNQARKKKTNGIMIIVFLIILIIVILLAFLNSTEQPKSNEQNNTVSTHVENQKGEDIDKNAIIY